MAKKPKLLRYLPPKSQIWGHAMNRMAPPKFRAGVQAFLRKSVRRCGPTWCRVRANDCGFTDTDAADFIRAFVAENDLRIAPDRNDFGNQTDEHFDQCLDWLLARWPTFSALSAPSFDLSLTRYHDIKAWDFESSPAEANLQATLGEIYGCHQILGTDLRFHNLAEYQSVQSQMREALGVELSDKHLTPRTALNG